MTLGKRTDIQEDTHWAKLADDINRHWSEKFNAVQRQRDTMLGADFGSSDIAALCEHMSTLSEIVADLARQMAEYHKWRQS